MSDKPKRQTHNYTSELELKTLLIRVKNFKFNNIEHDKDNSKIDRYVKTYTVLKDKKYPEQSKIDKKKRICKKLKSKAIELSEGCSTDNAAYNRFGEIVLLMIKKILTKGQFSGYTYKDEFYSDASHKILKYLHNFNHLLISERSGQHVNAFAYISQIIHNSVVFVIKSKNKEQKNIKKQISYCSLDHGLNIKNEETNNESTFLTKFEQEAKEKDALKENNVININEEEIKKHVSLYNIIKNKEIKNSLVIYPETYRISLDEYSKLKELFKQKINVSIQRERIEECSEE